jgi:tryptophanyl-tRNA synthetase
MGKSAGNAIYLKDPPEEIKAKVNSAITDPERIRATDPGHPEICNIFQYHTAFNQLRVKEVEQSCRQGRIGCVTCKGIVADRIIAYLSQFQDKRAFYETRPAIYREALNEGIRRTRREGKKTMAVVREAMHFDYKTLLC